MQLLNDKEKDAKISTETSVLAIASHTAFTALGMASMVLGPLPMILSQIRLTPPWPRVVALAGAVVALALLGVSLFPVLLTFVFGLYIADNIDKERNFWWLLVRAVSLAAILGGGSILVLSQTNKMGVWSFWTGLIDSIVAEGKAVIRFESDRQWDAIRTRLLIEGPSMYISLAALSLWLSISAAAHLKWLKNGHPLSSDSLRQLRLPKWLGVVFIVFWTVDFGGYLKKLSGLYGGLWFLGSIMFIQGCVYLSNILSLRRIQPRVRSLIYVLSIALGYHVIVGLGALGPWVIRFHKPLAYMEEHNGGNV